MSHIILIQLSSYISCKSKLVSRVFHFDIAYGWVFTLGRGLVEFSHIVVKVSLIPNSIVNLIKRWRIVTKILISLLKPKWLHSISRSIIH